jgi:hypothetical protein
MKGGASEVSGAQPVKSSRFSHRAALALAVPELASLQRLFRAREDQLQAHPADDGQLVGEEVIIHQLDDSEARESVRGEAILYDFHEAVYAVLETGGQGRRLQVPPTGLRASKASRARSMSEAHPADSGCWMSKKRGRPVGSKDTHPRRVGWKTHRADIDLRLWTARLNEGASGVDVRVKKPGGRPLGAKNKRPRKKARTQLGMLADHLMGEYLGEL